MRILILGASGYTGKFLKEYWANKENKVYGTYRTENAEYQKDSSMFHLDMERAEELHDILRQTWYSYQQQMCLIMI